MNINEAQKEYKRVIEDLKSRGTYAGDLEFSPEGEWRGIVYEKNYDYTEFRDQVKFAKQAFNGSASLN